MSHYQFATLKYLRNHDVRIVHIRMLHQGTIGSLLSRGYIQRAGASITLTNAGNEAFERYSNGGPNYRKQEGDISERVALMLSLKLNQGAA